MKNSPLVNVVLCEYCGKCEIYEERLKVPAKHWRCMGCGHLNADPTPEEKAAAMPIMSPGNKDDYAPRAVDDRLSIQHACEVMKLVKKLGSDIEQLHDQLVGPYYPPPSDGPIPEGQKATQGLFNLLEERATEMERDIDLIHSMLGRIRARL